MMVNYAIKALENGATVREKEVFLRQLRNDVLSDLWAIYGRKGYATRKEKIAFIARSEKTAAEKLEIMTRFLRFEKQRKALFEGLGDMETLAIFARRTKHFRAWKGEFENEKKN